MAKFEIFDEDMQLVTVLEASPEFIQGFNPYFYREIQEITPQVVSPLQAMVALYQFELLDQVNEVINDPNTPEIFRLAWNKAIEFRRYSPAVLAIKTSLNWSDDQLDELFRVAAKIEV